MKKNKIVIQWIILIIVSVVFVCIWKPISFFWGMIIICEIYSIERGIISGIISGIGKSKEMQQKGTMEKFESVFSGMAVGCILGIFRGILFGIYDEVAALLCSQKSKKKRVIDNKKKEQIKQKVGFYNEMTGFIRLDSGYEIRIDKQKHSVVGEDGILYSYDFSKQCFYGKQGDIYQLDAKNSCVFLIGKRFEEKR